VLKLNRRRLVRRSKCGYGLAVDGVRRGDESDSSDLERSTTEGESPVGRRRLSVIIDRTDVVVGLFSSRVV